MAAVHCSVETRDFNVPLSDNQRRCVSELRRKGLYAVAIMVESYWMQGMAVPANVVAHGSKFSEVNRELRHGNGEAQRARVRGAGKAGGA